MSLLYKIERIEIERKNSSITNFDAYKMTFNQENDDLDVAVKEFLDGSYKNKKNSLDDNNILNKNSN